MESIFCVNKLDTKRYFKDKLCQVAYMSKRTPLYEAHLALNGKMVDFAGYLMPIRYKKTSIIDEHLQVRNSVGMFDTSHMGRYWVTGKDAKELLDYLVPRDIMKLSDGIAGYSFMLNESGGFRDDVIISQFTETEFMIVCNAGNRDKIWRWIVSYANLWIKAGKEIVLEDKSDASAMIAVQGPKAISLLEKLSGVKLPDKRFRVQWIEILGEKILFSTTGYTGENGGELIIFKDLGTIDPVATKIWNLLLENEVMPCALGSRDTLRMESGYRLYGNDIEEHIHLLESGLDFYPFADIDSESGYIGQPAVLDRKGKIDLTFVGFKLLDKGIPRHEHKVIIDGEEKGVVLSGTQSPVTKVQFGMALVPLSHKDLGSRFEIDIRGKLKRAEVVNFPIFDKNTYGIK